ncbi:NAD-dependent nucleoside diphosphate-sugar epimerase/dehydratase [Desulfuromonas versatilis]|uniref:NAD-dependent nucleoside diphosphate-sugar epimerase/dehydratase n=1 Tax=Desulfuromonas versatilis TaxID=2802975 RepID=A0ABN6E3H6_9BACT|nr:complex I NDUFA9 subunit family protein [Desulfuromonas versatilis]BCR06888.1 NAD-dependent nucleoside diphosphate-sugar epimerase/dehydratase [Desulfuromonas versatilis]
MKVFVTGATGFVGGEVLRQLLAAGHQARCLVRKGSEGKLPATAGIEVRHGDATEAASLQGLLEGCDAVIHLVGIIREFPNRRITFERLHVAATRNLVEAARAQGVRRYLQMSANGAAADGSTEYHRTKWRAEELVRGSQLDWTIFRPSLIFGRGSEFVTMLADLIRKLPALPVFGDGRYRMSPVAVADVAKTFAAALNKPETIGRSFHCCGTESYSYNEILDLTGQALGKSRVCKIHQPLFLIKPVVSLLQGVPLFPITSTQLTMLLEGNVCDPADWAQAFGIQPTSYAEGIKAALS